MGLITWCLCLSCCIKNTDNIVRCEVRLLAVFCALISVADVVTDVVVIHGWLNRDEPEVEASGLAIIFMVFSDILSLVCYCFIYYEKFDKERPTMCGILTHLLGLGTMYDAIVLCSKPAVWSDRGSSAVLNFKEDDEQYVAKTKRILFYVIKAIESLVEATPQAILQAFMMVKDQKYGYFPLASISLSFLCTGIPVSEFVNIFDKDFNMNSITRLIFVLSWASDMFVRSLPLVYLLVHYSCYGVVAVVVIWIVEMIFIWKFVEDKLVASVIGGISLLISSLVKIVKAKATHGLETLVRFTLSMAVAVLLYCLGIIRSWQLGVFCAVAFFTGVIHVYVFYHMKDLGSHIMYDGYRLDFKGFCNDFSIWKINNRKLSC